MLKTYRCIIFINVLVALAYWGVSHLNWIFFHKVGILPMPIWPAAALAFLAGLYWGWSIAPALAAGTILANHYSLGATWIYASCVAVMNTLGPLTAVWLVHKKDSAGKYSILSKFSWLIAAGLFLAPAMTASGGIGSQLLLGMIEWKDFSIKWLRWFMAHSVGTLIFVCPVLVFYPLLWQQKSDTGRNDWLEHAGKITAILTVGLALLLWFGDSLLRLLWFKIETDSPAEILLPIHTPQELLSRIFVFISVLFAGGAISRLLKNLAESHRNLEQSNLALKESEAIQHTLLANLPAGIIIVDPETKIIENVNNTAANMFGFKSEQITGKRCHSFLCPANEGSCPVCDLGQNVDNSEREMLCADKSRRPILKSVKKIQIKGKEKLLECFIDISAQKQTEEALQWKTALLEAQLNTAIDGILVIDENQKRIVINQRIIDQWNVPKHILDDEDDTALLNYVVGLTKYPEQFIGKVMYLYDHPQETSRDEIEFKNGMVLDRYSAPVLGKDGHHYGRIWTFRDITEHKLAEKAQIESLARFTGFAEASQYGMGMAELDGRIIFVNHTLSNMLGEKSPEHCNGKHFPTTYYPPSMTHKLHEEVMPALLKHGKWHGELELLSIDGRRIPTDENYFVITDEQGKPRYLADILTDITERKQAEKALLESEAMLRKEQHYTQLLLDTSPAYIVAIGFDGKTLMMNKALLDAVEYTREEITGIDYLNTFVPEEDRELLSSVFQQIVEEKKATVNENRIISKSGKIYLVEWHGRTVARGKSNIDFFVGVGIDITDRKKTEEEKKKLEDQLSQAQKMESVGRLAGGVAHDFNNMLNVILGYSALLLGEFGHDHPFFAYIDEIRNAAERSADLTRQLLAFARKQTIAPKVLNLNETIEEMLNMLRRLIGEDINLAWLPKKDLWYINIDPAQVDQILVNLMVNSRDAIEGVGRITIETENVIFNESYCAMHTGFTTGEYVMLAISDTGCGMDEETLSHIYEPFYTTKSKGKGIGLGMATVYGIIKQNNGFINVYSEPGQGTTIKVYIPKHAGTDYAMVFEDIEETATGGHETILLVEDEPATLKLGQIILKELGYTVITANTPGEAIRIAEENSGRIHLLITDVIMPEMNGRDLANKLLSMYPDIKILFMSGYTANVIAHHGILDKGVHFIQKPFTMNNLASKAREALDG